MSERRSRSKGENALRLRHSICSQAHQDVTMLMFVQWALLTLKGMLSQLASVIHDVLCREDVLEAAERFKTVYGK